MNPALRTRILSASTYPTGWKLEERELEDMLAKHEQALGTTNGDAGPVEITARQLILLMRAVAAEIDRLQRIKT